MGNHIAGECFESIKIMVPEHLELREKLYGNSFHLDLSTELWQSSYLNRPGVGGGVLEVRRGGKLKGYAVCSVGEIPGQFGGDGSAD